jgi:uncharacterized protein
MNAQLLADASREALCRLAEEHAVEYTDDTPRDELIELIVEAFEESRREHEAANNYPVRVEETKYQSRAPQPPAVAEAEGTTPDDSDAAGAHAVAGYDVPDTYNETRIVLLLRDPAWAFAYWDVKDAQIRAFRSRDDFDGLGLRVHQLPAADAAAARSLGSFDIPVGVLDNRWYIHLPEQQTHYRLSLLVRFSDGEEALAASNVIYAPRGALAAENTDSAERPTDEILAYTGIHDLDVRPIGDHLPQRILSLIDEDLMFH